MEAATDPRSVAGQVRALRAGCGVVERGWAECLELRGADRQRFLNAYVTCDVKALNPGEGAYGFLTNPQGRVLAELEVLAEKERLWIVLPSGQAAAVAQHLARYVIADRVEIVRRDSAGPALGQPPGQGPEQGSGAAGAGPLAALLVAGPRAGAALARLAPQAALPDRMWHHVQAEIAGVQVMVERTGRSGVPALTLWAPAPDAPRLAAELAAQDGVQPVSRAACEVVRVEAGIARFGQDFGPQNFPQETGAEDGVSYTKGCYLGQEVVARIHYRGGVQKMLCGLQFDGRGQGDAGAADAAPQPGAALLYEGREAGALGSVVYSPTAGRWIGLAILHRRAAEPGSRLQLAPAAETRDAAALPPATGELPPATAPAATGEPPAADRQPAAGGGGAEVCALPFVAD